MKRLRGIDTIKEYLRNSEIFTLYVPKECDCNYRLTVSKMMDDYQYITERFHNLNDNYLLFYPKEYRLPSDPNYKILFKYREEFCLANTRRRRFSLKQPNHGDK